MQPFTLIDGLDDALGTKNYAVFICIDQLRQDFLKFIGRIFFGSFLSPAAKYIISMMMMVVMAVVMVMMMLMVVAAALRVMSLPLMVMMVMFMFMFIFMLMLMFILMFMFVVMMVLVVVTAALRVMALPLMVMMFMVMVMMFMFMVMVVLVLMLLLLYLGYGKQRTVCQGGQNLAAAQFVPRGSNNRRLRVVLTDNLHSLSQLLFRHILAAAQHNAVSMGNLIHEELPIIPGVHLALLGVNYGNAAVQDYIITQHGGNSLLYIRQLAHP